MFWLHALLASTMIGMLAAYAVHPSSPREPLWHRLVCLVPLSLIAGTVLAVVATT